MRPQVFLEDRMKIVNTVGRVVVGSAFMMFGYEAAKEPGSRVQAVEALGVPQPELAVRLNGAAMIAGGRSEEHTSELQSRFDLVCRLLLEKKKKSIGWMFDI